MVLVVSGGVRDWETLGFRATLAPTLEGPWVVPLKRVPNITPIWPLYGPMSFKMPLEKQPPEPGYKPQGTTRNFYLPTL